MREYLSKIKLSGIVAGGVLVALLTGCSGGEKQNGMAPQAPTVSVSKPDSRVVTEYAEFTGKTEAVETAEIFARVEGIIEKIHFKAGDFVKKGDLLYSIDRKPYQTKVNEAKAMLEIREAELKLAESTNKRRRGAFKDRAVSEISVIESESKLASAKGAFAAAGAALEKAVIDLDYTRIRASISGRVGRTLVDPGNLVGPGKSSALTTIVNANPLYVYFTVSEREVLKFNKSDRSPLRKGGPVSMVAGSGGKSSVEGKVDFTASKIDAETGTIEVRGVFANPDYKMLPGVFARVKIPLAEASEKLLVKDTVLGRDQRGSYLFTIDKDNVVQYKLITKGSLVGAMRIIRSGLDAGDRVVVNSIQKVRPGMKVNPVEPGTSSGAASVSGE